MLKVSQYCQWGPYGQLQLPQCKDCVIVGLNEFFICYCSKGIITTRFCVLYIITILICCCISWGIKDLNLYLYWRTHAYHMGGRVLPQLGDWPSAGSHLVGLEPATCCPSYPSQANYPNTSPLTSLGVVMSVVAVMTTDQCMIWYNGQWPKMVSEKVIKLWSLWSVCIPSYTSVSLVKGL